MAKQVVELPTVDRTCGGCAFWWVEGGTEEGSVQRGQCRIRAPAAFVGQSEYLARQYIFPPGDGGVPELVHASGALWPETREWDWCGEWKRSG